MESRIFALSRDVSNARKCFCESHYMSFIGCMSKAVQTAADLAFNGADGRSRKEIDAEVRSVLERKLAKWITQKTNGKDLTEVKLDQSIQKNYMEELDHREHS